MPSKKHLIPFLFIGIFLLGISNMLSRVIGYNFVPSVRWVSGAYIFGIAGGSISAFGGILPILKRAATTSDDAFYKVILGIVGAPFFGFILGSNIVFATVPMFGAILFGRENELSFTVGDTERIGYKTCRSFIRLRELPFGIRDICGVSADFLKK